MTPAMAKKSQSIASQKAITKKAHKQSVLIRRLPNTCFLEGFGSGWVEESADI